MKEINKYKVVSLVLALALLTAMARLVYLTNVPAPAEGETTSSVYDNILARKSVRSFTDEPVSQGAVDSLLRAAMAAPSGRDMRPWKFVAIDSRPVLDSLMSALPYAKMLASAPVAIVVCADLSVVDDKGKPSANWVMDCSAATENLLLCAESMRLGAVWTGVYPYEERQAAVSAVLGLPQHVVPLCLVPVGHPAGNPQPKDKYVPDNIRYNHWEAVK